MATAKNTEDFVGALWSNQLLNAIVEIQAAFIEESDLRTSFSRMLGCLLDLTHSEYGFLGEVLYTSEGLPYLKTHALTDISWDAETKELYDTNMAKGFEFHNLNTLFGVTLATGEVVISNDPDSDPRSGGLPPGHPGMKNYLGVPIKHLNDMHGMLGIANREGGYQPEIVDALSPLLVTAGSMIHSMRNALARQAIEDELKEKHKLLDGVIRNISDALIITDFEGTVLEVNRAAEKMFEYRAQELIGRSISKCLAVDSREAYSANLKNLLLAGDRSLIPDRCEMWGYSKKERRFAIDMAVNDIKLGDRKLFVNVVQDISERKAQAIRTEEANKKLQELSETDELTGLHNRRYFDKNIRKEFNRGRRTKTDLALAIVDIDNFKAYNDNYGHPQGDQCLMIVGQFLRDFFKRDSEFVARVGGEEFAIVIAQEKAGECVSALEALLECIRGENIEHAYSMMPHLTFSIGLAMRTADDASTEDIYQRADYALYAAKEGGRDQLVVADEVRSLLAEEEPDAG
jgi:diguanylate cyclase (GGDEF)-like protein/PAS domain S-box-containing protein